MRPTAQIPVPMSSFSAICTEDVPIDPDQASTRKVDLSQMDVASQRKLALERIMKVASKREISSVRMGSKLRGWGFCDQAISEAMDDARRLSAIDDVRYADCLIRTTLAMGKGLSKVEREIKELGIDIMGLDSYQQYVDDGEEAQVQSALDLLKSHPPHSKNMNNAAFKKLVSKGYSIQVASQATKMFLQGEDGSC